MNADSIITQTRCWIRSVVVGCNFCPFAKRELERDSIRYAVCDDLKLEICLEKVIEECVLLDADDSVETTLIIYSAGFEAFDDFLTCIEIASDLLSQQGYDGVYQLASFHPDYCFAGSDAADAANYTNRSPFPMLHLLRESSLEKALESYPDPEAIPERNVDTARKLGLDAMREKLEACLHE